MSPLGNLLQDLIAQQCALREKRAAILRKADEVDVDLAEVTQRVEALRELLWVPRLYRSATTAEPPVLEAEWSADDAAEPDPQTAGSGSPAPSPPQEPTPRETSPRATARSGAPAPKSSEAVLAWMRSSGLRWVTTEDAHEALGKSCPANIGVVLANLNASGKVVRRPIPAGGRTDSGSLYEYALVAEATARAIAGISQPREVP